MPGRNLLFVVTITCVCGYLCPNNNQYYTSSGIICIKCRPGTFFQEDCTENFRDANCSSCPVDIECSCLHGLFKIEGSGEPCSLWTPCPPGYRVTYSGTTVSDTECEKCEVGHYLPNSSFRESCLKCSPCGSGQVKDPKSCNGTTDTFCTDLDSDSGLSVEGVVGIVIGCIVAVLLLVLLALYTFCKRKNYKPVIYRKQISWKGFDHKTAIKEEDRQWNTIDSRVSAGCLINIRGPGHAKDTVLNEEIRLKATKSVGLISFRDNTATCFRVGTNMIMTANHVMKSFIEIGGNLSIMKDAFVVFNHLQGEPKNFAEQDKFYLKPMNHKQDILFCNDATDCVVLELLEKEGMPPPLEHFGFPELDKGFNFVAHSVDIHNVKCTDKVDIIIKPNSEETRQGVKKLQKYSKKYLEKSGKNILRCMPEDIYDNILNKERFLVQCCSGKGASGAPGISVKNGKPVVVTMLLHGYPDWYYHPDCADIQHAWPKELCVEQSANMLSIAGRIFSKNTDLFHDIFKGLEHFEYRMNIE